MKKSSTRRQFIKQSALLAGGVMAPPLIGAGGEAAARQATGTKVGEVTDTSAIVWTRLTAAPTRKNDGVFFPPRKGKSEPRPKLTVPASEVEGACPGAAGRIRVRYGTKEDLSDAQETEWMEVSEATDYTHPFSLAGLKPASAYHYVVETAGPGGAEKHGSLCGRFDTAPETATPSNLRFCVMTCQGYKD